MFKKKKNLLYIIFQLKKKKPAENFLIRYIP